MISHSARNITNANALHIEHQNMIKILSRERQNAVKLGDDFVAYLLDMAVLALHQIDQNHPDTPSM